MTNKKRKAFGIPLRDDFPDGDVSDQEVFDAVEQVKKMSPELGEKVDSMVRKIKSKDFIEKQEGMKEMITLLMAVDKMSGGGHKASAINLFEVGTKMINAQKKFEKLEARKGIVRKVWQPEPEGKPVIAQIGEFDVFM